MWLGWKTQQIYIKNTKIKLPVTYIIKGYYGELIKKGYDLESRIKKLNEKNIKPSLSVILIGNKIGRAHV